MEGTEKWIQAKEAYVKMLVPLQKKQVISCAKMITTYKAKRPRSQITKG